MDDAASDAALWGIDLPAPTHTGVWPGNVEAVRAFQRIASLFRSPGPMGGACGLDYSGARDGLLLAGITPTPELWAQVQCIEQGAIEAVMGRGS